MGHRPKIEITADRGTKFEQVKSIVTWEKWRHVRGRHAVTWTLGNYVKRPHPKVKKFVSIR